jgi:hypothetical protein
VEHERKTQHTPWQSSGDVLQELRHAPARNRHRRELGAIAHARSGDRGRHLGFTMLHELVCFFVWCSLSAWWIGQRMGELKGGR